MSVAVKKIDGVQSVNVSLKNGLVTIHLAPGNRVTMPQLRKLITSNGFSPREAMVSIDGVLDPRSSPPRLTADGTNEVFNLTATPNAPEAFEQAKRTPSEAAHVEISGRIDPPNGQEQLAVGSVKRLP